jgi:hypothetical protein
MTPREHAAEHLPYATCLVLGILLRIHGLGSAPLSIAEAAVSWASWSTAAAGPPVLSLLSRLPESPALFGLQCGVFWLAGGAGGDFTARLVPALVGSAMILLPWFARRAQGRATSVALALLLALDPWLLGFSRLADGAILAAAAAWTIIVGSLVLATPQGCTAVSRPRWVACVWTASGVLLVSGPAGWDFLPPVAVAVFLVAGSGAAAGIRFALGGALLVATTGLTQWQGPQLWSESLEVWSGRWLAGDGLSLSAFAAHVLRYQSLIVTLGVAGLASWYRRSRQESRIRSREARVDGRRELLVLTFWLAWGALVLLRPGRTAGAWLVIQLPLLLGAAVALGELAGAMRGRVTRTRPVLAGMAVVALLGLLSLHGSLSIVGDRAPVRLGSGSSIRVAGRHGPDPALGWALRDEPVRGSDDDPFRREGIEPLRIRPH